MKLDDETDRGPWMQVHSGGRFFPLDPRPEEIFADDIANGLALDCRYAGQGRVDRFYSVAEHCVHLAKYAFDHCYFGNGEHEASTSYFALLMLLHDAPEAYINDLNRATKKAVGPGYGELEDRIHAAVFEKYGLVMTDILYERMKDLDRRIVPLEKDAIQPHPGAWHHPWAFDQFKDQALGGVTISCWAPPDAKRNFLNWLEFLCRKLGKNIEGAPL